MEAIQEELFRDPQTLLLLAEKRLQSTAYEFRYVKVRVMDQVIYLNPRMRPFE
jgi:hypothetical protein